MIEIKYYNGEMLIDPQYYFDSGNATVGKFRKIIKLSAESDLIYGTNAIEAWIAAVNEELSKILVLAKVEMDDHKRNVDRANQTAEKEKWDYERKKKVIELFCKRLNNKLKKISTRKRKFEKFSEILNKTRYCGKQQYDDFIHDNPELMGGETNV